MLQICVTVTWSGGESDVTPKSIKLVSANSTPVMDLQGSGTCHAHPSVALAFLGKERAILPGRIQTDPRGNNVPRGSGMLLLLPAVCCLGELWEREDFRPFL